MDVECNFVRRWKKLYNYKFLPMAMIPQISIFDNTEVYDNLGELKKIKLILDNIPDENLLASIRKEKDI